jgi:hypothetical protein
VLFFVVYFKESLYSVDWVLCWDVPIRVSIKIVIISGSKHVKGIGEKLVRNLSMYIHLLFQTAGLKVFNSSD